MMSLKHFNLVFLIINLELFLPSDTDQWYKTFCEDSLCLYFNGTSVYAQSNEEANNICSRSGFMLLEIPNARVQEIVDKATASWGNDVNPLNGFHFRLNLVQVVEQNWKWISTNRPLDSTESISSYPYFALVHINSSGLYFFTEFERLIYPSICSCEGTCKNPGSCSIRDSGSNFCYEVVDTAANWFESRSNCQNKGGDLATIIKSPSPQWISNVHAGNYWIGLTKAKYVWSSTGQTSNYFKWFDGEPIPGNECTYIMHSGDKFPNYFRKAPCNDSRPFFCMNGTVENNQTVQRSAARSSDPSNFGILAGVATFGIAVIVMKLITRNKSVGRGRYICPREQGKRGDKMRLSSDTSENWNLFCRLCVLQLDKSTSAILLFLALKERHWNKQIFLMSLTNLKQVIQNVKGSPIL